MTTAHADEDESSDVFPVADSRAIAEFEKQTAAPPPDADKPQELCIFLHQRGVAHTRLGHYDQALADLRQALTLRHAASPERWCDRWRLQGDLYAAIHSIGDWQLLIEHAQSVSDEYGNSNRWHYFSAQLWQVEAQINLANLRKAEEAFQRASEALPSLSQQKGWSIYRTNFLGRHSSFAARMQELRGNYVEAERFRRQALSYGREFLDKVSSIRSRSISTSGSPLAR